MAWLRRGALALVIIGLATASVAQIPEFADMQFKDWRVACDNVRHCRSGAGTPLPDHSGDDGREGPNDTSLFVERGGEPGAAATVKIERTGRRAVRLAWHGGQDWIDLRASDNFYLPSSDATKLLDALKRNQSFDLLDKSGRKVGAISLAGANAALLWMDDQQHRTGTITALIRPGSKPLSSVPEPPPLPVIHATRTSAKAALTPSMYVQKALAKSSSCDFGASTDDIWFYRLDVHHTMALLICPDHNDNPGGDVSVIDDAKPNRPTSPKMPTTVGQSWRWDPKTRTLEDGMISHGSMDCSFRDVFVWTGSAFKTKERYEVCPDSGLFYVYRARVVYDR